MKTILKSIIQTFVLLAIGIFAANLVSAQAIWTNSTGDLNWSTAINWSPNVVPVAAANVVFTNNVGAPSTAATATTVDNIVDANRTVASLQYANTNALGGNGFYHTTQINAGQTLTVLGGLKVGYDQVSPFSLGAQVYVTITGAGTLVVSNLTADLFVEKSDGANNGIATLNMTNLNTFNATIGGIKVGVDANNQARPKGILYLAKTNNINVFGNSSLPIANMSQIEIGDGQGGGSSLQVPMYLGLVNNIFVNSITVNADKQGSGAMMVFNPSFTNSSPTAYFRGTNGIASRVARWYLADNSHQTTTGSGTGTGLCDFTGGTLDAMVDAMTLGLGETGAGGAATSTAVFTFNNGTNNVNTLILGARLSSGGTGSGVGTMNVNGTATLVVNNAICLSYWSGGTLSASATGNLNINGGTVLANTITNGVYTGVGVTVNNNAYINMTGGTLAITSLLGSIGTPTAPINTLGMSGSTLQLAVSGIQTNVVVSSLNANGTTNIINISSLPANVITYPTQFPLIAYSPGNLSGFNFGVSNLPGTYLGYISNNTANSSIDLVLTSGPTTITALKWSGAASDNWDTTSINWLNGASPVAYFDGASVIFDDSATGLTGVNLVANFSPSSVTVNNNSLPYAFSGSGIIGSANLTKNGSGTLLFTNAGNSFIGGVTINNGSVQFGNGGTSGNLPATGNVLDNGNLIFNRSGNVALPNVISGTGTITKNGTSTLTLTASNDFSGTAMVNSGTLLVNGVLSGSLANAVGATIGGSGTNAGPVNVSGLIQPSAATGTPSTFTSGDLNLSAGATLKFTLNGPDATVGSGSNDLLNVAGNLNANNNVIALNITGVPQTAVPYTLVNYSGSLGGSFNSTVIGTHYTATLNQATPNVINVSLSGSGASLKWDCATNGGFWDIGTTTNWLNTGSSSLDVFYSGDNVTFDDTAVATNLTIASGVAVSPNTIVVNSSAKNFTISGSGEVSGSGSLVKLGSSTLRLNTPNHDFHGTASIQGGILQAGNNSALVGATTTVTNGATLDINGFAYVNGSQVVTVSGAGVGGNGALINSGADQQSGFQNITLAGDTTVGGSGRFDMRQSGANPLTLNSADGNPYNLAVVGPGQFNLVSVTIDPALGNVDVKGGTFALQVNALANSPAWAGDTSKTITVESNATLGLFNLGAGTSLSRRIVLNDGAILYNESGVNVVSGSVTLQGNDTFQVDNIGTTPTLTMSGVIGGSGNLIKTGISTLALQGAHTYTGSTLVNAGSFQLGLTGVSDGSIPGSSNIIIAAGAVLDASERTDQTLTLASGQTLQGNGTIYGALVVGAGATVSAGTNSSSIGALTVTNGVTLQGNTLMKLNPAIVTSDVINVIDGATNTFGGTLTLTNISATPFAIGNSFQLFNAASYSGAFTSIVPATPGAGLAWNTNNLSSGTLSVVAGAAAPQPGITSISLSGTSLVINGTNGVAGESYNLLTTTNLALPLSQWTVLATNTFSAGSFSITNTVNASAPQNFYILRVP